MRAYKFRIYPTKTQDIEMRRHLWIAKELWNDLLEHTKEMYRNFSVFPTRNALQIMVKGSGLYSQTGQDIAHRIEAATKRYITLKRKGVKVGFPRFRNFERMKSLSYPQSGFELGEKLKVTPFGGIRIVQHREVVGTVKTLALKHESSGKWFAVFTVIEPAVESKNNNGSEVGIDVGLKCFARLSNDGRIANPRHFKQHEKRLAKIQRKLSRKKKRSRNWNRTKIEVAKVHERISNARNDFLHKTSRRLVNEHSLIALEKLEVQKMSTQNFGKSINDAGWSSFANMLSYKAGNAGCKVVFVEPEGTTKTCHRCGHVQDMPLSVRTYCCPQCGMMEDRDLNAAKNILTRATQGHCGSNASGEVAVAAS